MKKFDALLFSIPVLMALAIGVVGYFKDPVLPPPTDRAAYQMLDKALIRLITPREDQFCSATKIADKTYLTAKHCFMAKPIYVAQFNGQTRNLLSVETPEEGDWAIVTLDEPFEDAQAIPFSCDEERYVTKPLAYLGEPSTIGRIFYRGYIMGIRDLVYVNWLTSMRTARGMSGSGVISMDTGKLIGLMATRYADDAGQFASGVVDIKRTKLCHVQEQAA